MKHVVSRAFGIGLAAAVAAGLMGAPASAKPPKPITNLSITAKVPATPATPQSSLANGASTNVTSVTFNWSAPVTGGSFSCRLDSRSTINGCVRPKSFSGLADGTHHFSVTESAKGYRSKTVTFTWTVDTVRPGVPVPSVSPATANKAHPFVTVTWPSVSGATSYLCEVDNPSPSATYTACSSGWTTPTLATDGSVDGAHTVYVKARDAAGNLSAMPGTAVFGLDSQAPTISIQNAPADPNNAASVSIDFTVAGATSVSCSDGTVTTPSCTSPQTVSTATDGSYTFTVNASDAAGNASTKSVSWTRNASAPSAPSVSAGPAAYTTDANPSFTWADVPSATSYSCSVDGGAASACTSGVHEAIASQTPSPHVFSVTASNGANTSAAGTWSWTFDNTAPTVSVTNAPSGAVNVASAAPTVTGNDNNPGVTVACTLTGPTPSATCGPYSSLSDGHYTLVATATDAAGNHSSDVTRSWTVDTHAPTAVLHAPATINAPVTVAFSEPVHGLAGGSVALQLTDTGASVPTTLVCKNGSSAVSCTNGTFTSVVLNHSAWLTAGQHYTATVAAGAVKDAATNASAAKSLAFRVLSLQENVAGPSFTWQTVKTTSAFGGSYLREHLAGAVAAWSFTGTNVTWWTNTGPHQGKAFVFVDGVRKLAVNNYAGSAHAHVARTVKGLSNRKHKVEIYVRGLTGTRRSTGTSIGVDAFQVGSRRIASPSLATTWRQPANVKYSGGRAAVADEVGETVRLVFRGTGISWFTQRGPTQGIAKVYVDGVLKATVDNYAASNAFGVKRSVTGLTDTTHTLKILVTGAHHTGGAGTIVTFDRVAIA